MPRTNGLTPKQAAFVDEYCTNGFNATQAVMSAGYVTNSVKAAQVIGSQNLSKVIVKQAVDSKLAETRQKNEVKIEFIRSEHQRLATKAELAGDLVNATRNLELLGKTIAAYVDKHQFEAAYPGQRPADAIEASQERIKAVQSQIVEGKG